MNYGCYSIGKNYLHFCAFAHQTKRITIYSSYIRRFFSVTLYIFLWHTYSVRKKKMRKTLQMDAKSTLTSTERKKAASTYNFIIQSMWIRQKRMKLYIKTKCKRTNSPNFGSQTRIERKNAKTTDQTNPVDAENEKHLKYM